MSNSLIKIFGGKQLQQRELKKLLVNDCDVFISGFAGGIPEILCHKPRKKEIVLDTNFDIINLYRVLRDDEHFINYISGLDYSESVFNTARDSWVNEIPRSRRDSLLRAINYLILNRMSFDGKGKNYAFSERLRGGRPENINSWENLKKRLPKLRERISRVFFINSNFMDWIKTNSYLNNNNVLIYNDPPYLHDVRTTNNDYGDNEMSDNEHIYLLNQISDCKCRMILCGYDNDLYNNKLSRWNKTSFNKHVNGGTGKKNNRVEVMWYNYSL